MILQKKISKELLAAKEAAEFANRSKTEFLANMSHELRTPLNAILGYAYMIENQIENPKIDKNYKKYASIIQQSGQHLLEVLSDILDVSKIEISNIELDETLIEIQDLVEFCCKVVQERAKEKDIKFDFKVSPYLPKLKGDERRIKQVLLNLLTNSVKFIKDKGEIIVSAQIEKDGRLSLCVKDDGIGIPKKDINKVTEPFFQGDETALTRGHQQGAGLGLALVRTITRLHDGDVEIKSIEGEGTEICVHFPQNRVVN